MRGKSDCQQVLQPGFSGLVYDDQFGIRPQTAIDGWFFLPKETEQHVRGEFRTSDGMFTVTTDQKIKSWNASAEKIFGYARDEVIGKKCYDVLSANGSSGRVNCSRACVVTSNAAKGRTTRDFDLQCKTSSGELKSINMSIVLPTRDSDSREIIHLFRDVTDRRRVERASAPNAGQETNHSKKPPPGSGLTPTGYKLPPLTTREDQVLKLLAAGKNTNDIAEILAIRPLTARNHISRLLTKLGCRSRLEAVALGTRAGLI